MNLVCDQILRMKIEQSGLSGLSHLKICNILIAIALNLVYLET